MMDYRFLIEMQPTQGGVWLIVRGQRVRRYGPYPALQLATHREALFQRWQRAAIDRGGWAWKATDAQWMLTLPAQVPCDGLAPDHRPCSQHTP